MVIVVPMLIEQVYALTLGVVKVKGPGTFSNVEGQMRVGKSVQGPDLNFPHNNQISWVSRGDPEGTSEEGIVTAFFGDASFGGGTVIFFWLNPFSGDNNCLRILGSRAMDVDK